MFEVGSIGGGELGARSSFDSDMGLDELLAIQNTMFQTRTVCKDCFHCEFLSIHNFH